MKNIARTLLIVALFIIFAPLSAEARQYAVRQGGRDYVAHTRRAPVAMHRALPPYRGAHIYVPAR